MHAIFRKNIKQFLPFAATVRITGNALMQMPSIRLSHYPLFSFPHPYTRPLFPLGLFTAP